MSGSVSLSLFCIIHRQQDATPFSVRVNNDKTIDELKKLIKEGCKPWLDHVPTHTLKLRKWNQPVAGDIGSNLDRIDVLIPMKKIRDIFCGDDFPKEDAVHIIITVAEPELAPSIHHKLDKMLSNMDCEETLFELFHKKYWGKGDEDWAEICKSQIIYVRLLDDLNGPESHLDVPEQPQTTDYGYKYIELGHDMKVFFDRVDLIIVRDEYQEVLKHITKLKEEDETVGGIVLLGQPGIGKSPMLSCTGFSKASQPHSNHGSVGYITSAENLNGSNK